MHTHVEARAAAAVGLAQDRTSDYSGTGRGGDGGRAETVSDRRVT